MTNDEIRELIVAALKTDDRMVRSSVSNLRSDEVVAAEDTDGRRWWITVDEE